jgi:acyl dehydratase
MMVVPFDGPDLKEPTWENVVIGEEFGPLDIVLSDHAVNSYTYAVDDYNPWYVHDSPFGGKIAPDALVGRALLDLMNLRYDAKHLRALHVREEVELFGPVKVGQRLTLRSRVTDKFLKRGEPRIVFDAQACDEEGKTLIRAKHTELFRGDVRGGVGQPSASPNSNAASDPIGAETPTVDRSSCSPDIGAVLPTLSKKITTEQMFVFSFGVPNIHTDPATASKAGLAGPIAQGLMSSAYISQLLVNFFGPDWFGSGWTSHAFVKPVSAGDTLTVHGKIQNKQAEAEGIRLIVEVWCRNQEGELTTIGCASALVTQ